MDVGRYPARTSRKNDTGVRSSATLLQKGTVRLHLKPTCHSCHFDIVDSGCIAFWVHIVFSLATREAV